MTVSDYSITAFALLNGARIIAYAPQIRCLARDDSNAASVSLVTWVLFTLANAATVAYALVVIDDQLMAGIFVLNLLGCLTIVVMIAKRRIYSSVESPGNTLPERWMLAWRRRAEERLAIHLRLTLPTGRMKDRMADSPSIKDRYRHHPLVRE
jgi:hypothetical protein